MGLSWSRVQGLGFRVQGLGFRGQGLWFRVQGLGLRVQGLSYARLGVRLRYELSTDMTSHEPH